MEEKDSIRPTSHSERFGPPWLTVETSLYLSLVLAAALLRSYALGRQPLQQKEAQLALDAWRFYAGGTASIRGHAPLLFHGNVFLYLLFGANDYVARVIPALAGSLLVGLPYLLRSYLGRWGALVTSVLLALSPSFLFFSRQLDGGIIVSAATLALLAAVLGYVRQGKPSQLYLLAGSLAITLLAGGDGYANLLVLGAFLALLALYSHLSRRESPLCGTLPRAASTERSWFVPAGFFAGLILLISTGLFVNLQGVQAMLDLFSAWLGQFSPVTDAQPWHYYLSLLMAYDLPAVVFGLAGAFYFARRDLLSTLLACWFGVNLLLYSVMGTKPPSGYLQILLPLTLLAGKTMGELVETRGGGESWLWDRVAILVSLPVAFHMIVQLSAFGDPEDPGDPRHLMLVLLSLFFLVSVILITGAIALDWKGSLRTGGLVVLVILGGLMVHITWRLNYCKPGNPFELLVEEPTSPDVRNLVQAIEDFSNQREHQRHSVDITVAGGEDPLLAWYLREFRDLSFASGSPWPPARVIITPFEERPSLPDYRGARFRLQSAWRAGDLPAHDLANWYLSRESLSPPTHREVVMWVAPELEQLTR